MTNYLTNSDRTLTMKAQAAKYHCTLHTDILSSLIPANSTIVDAGIKTLVITKSANAIFTRNALPEILLRLCY